MQGRACGNLRSPPHLLLAMAGRGWNSFGARSGQPVDMFGLLACCVRVPSDYNLTLYSPRYQHGQIAFRMQPCPPDAPTGGQRRPEPQPKNSAETSEARGQLGIKRYKRHKKKSRLASDWECPDLTIQRSSLCFTHPAGLRLYISTVYLAAIHLESVLSPR